MEHNDSANAVIELCDQGHYYAKLPDHPTRDGSPRCPHCMAEGLDRCREKEKVNTGYTDDRAIDTLARTVTKLDGQLLVCPCRVKLHGKVDWVGGSLTMVPGSFKVEVPDNAIQVNLDTGKYSIDLEQVQIHYRVNPKTRE